MSLRQLTKHQTLTIDAPTGTDADNRPTYGGAGVQYRARIQVEDEVRTDVEGGEHVEVVVAYIEGDASAIERGNRLTVDETGRVAFVESVYPARDGQGRVIHTKVVAE